MEDKAVMKLTSEKVPFLQAKKPSGGQVFQPPRLAKLSAPALNHFHRHLLDKNAEPF